MTHRPELRRHLSLLYPQIQLILLVSRGEQVFQQLLCLRI